MDVQEFQNWDPQPGTMVEVYFADEGQESWSAATVVREACCVDA